MPRMAFHLLRGLATIWFVFPSLDVHARRARSQHQGPSAVSGREATGEEETGMVRGVVKMHEKVARAR